MRLMEWPNLALDTRAIYRAMGTVNSRQETHPVVAETISQLRSRALELIKARCVYSVVPVSVTGIASEPEPGTEPGSRSELGQIMLDHRLVLPGDGQFFQGASEAVVAVATVGPGLEQEASRLFKEGLLLEGLTIDACGIAALDEMMGLFRRDLTAMVAEQGQMLGLSLSPGCRVMPLESQRAVFALLEGSRIGVELTDACLMLPVKSCSVIIPVGAQLDRPGTHHHSCSLCERRQSCHYRPASLPPTV